MRMGSTMWIALAAAALAGWMAGCSSAPAGGAAIGGNRELVSAAFERWRARTGGPFELLAEDAEWTIVGSSPRSKTYGTKKRFMDEVITPFNARVAEPLMPTVRRIHEDGDTVIVVFDGSAPTKDGGMYRNTYAWFLEMRLGRIVRATAFFDTRVFDEFWTRVPGPG